MEEDNIFQMLVPIWNLFYFSVLVIFFVKEFF